MRIDAAPQLGVQVGLRTLSSEARESQAFECLNYYLQRAPEYVSTVSAIKDLVQQAREIYLLQASLSQTLPQFDIVQNFNMFDTMTTRVQRFKDTIAAFPPDSPCEQVLIWPVYIAAFACVTETHKIFFENLLLRYHARNGFRNLLKGVQFLRTKVWTRDLWDRWNSLAPDARIFVI